MNSRPGPAREDCWSEDATFSLIEAWGQRYVELNRGNLRQKQWQEVADAVNSRHGHNKKARRTDIQCKNRIDTLKKKYKSEKKIFLESNGNYKSSWPFFDQLDDLIGSTISLKKLLSPSPRISPTPPPPMAVPIAGAGAGILPQKRPIVAAAVPGSSDFRRNYSAIAAAAAAAESDEEEDEDEEEEERENEEREREEEEVSRGAEGIRKLARVIEKFGEVYAKVEAEKQRQMIELEKQRMQFAKELECQRMQMLVEMQVQLEKIKRAKRSDSNDMYS